MMDLSFMSFEEFEEAVGNIASELPDELFRGLNGGIVVRPDLKLHERSLPDVPLYVEGQYTRNSLGKQVIMYYGSFERVYPGRSREFVTAQIRRVLLHELRHHWEGLSGERALEEEDERNIESYLERNRRL